jgi:hypothetical protein
MPLSSAASLVETLSLQPVFRTPSNGAAITSYTATSTPGNFTASSATIPTTVSGLTNGTHTPSP